MLQNEIQRYHVDLLNGGVLTRSFNTVWASHKGNLSNPNYMWKMHLYADSYQDWYNLSRVVIPWLVTQNATFKTVNPDISSIEDILHNRSVDQFGKAFTIYPNDEQEFKRLALGLEQIMTQANLKTTPNLTEGTHNMAFERPLGKSGRIFYRAERDAQGQYVEACDAAAFNLKQTYNPYNLTDPFANLFDWQKPSVENIIEQIKSLSSVTHVKSSADNNAKSYYFNPVANTDITKLGNLFKSAGIKYDIHFSQYYGRNVIRVMDCDISKYLHLFTQQNTAKQQFGTTIPPHVWHAMQNKRTDM
jgi:hypothetical protein